ncbi:MAG: sn-glycerol-3-phosphate ABC transporter ATP-binding protein UgpC [Chloroflexota bacterium]|nr:sn-glycerol-3-phosphate ABC transporter ATP-binding protein UgpC [Chloroflexota bacterium]
MASVTFDHVTKRFDETPAITDLDLEIADREFLVLVGPSGCGKSTALRMLAGLETVTRGKIYIGDRLVNDVPAKDRDLAMVFQSYALYPHMSVYDNMAFGLKLRKVKKEEIRRRVTEAARTLDIEELLKRKPRQLSGGQRQRVAVGRAIVREPRAFLFDEPLSNLDAKLRVQTRAELSKLHERIGTTFIYVTHDQTEAMTMADRIAVLRDGIIQQVGRPQELYEHPDNIFVAGFIGSPAMNFFDATVRGEPESLQLDTGPFHLPIPREKAAGLLPYRGKKVVLGVRPESIHDSDFPRSGVIPVQVQAAVDVLELMGNEVFLHLLSDGVSFLARVDSRTKAKPGRKIQVLFDLGEMHAFDADTQQAIPLDKPF